MIGEVHLWLPSFDSLDTFSIGADTITMDRTDYGDTKNSELNGPLGEMLLASSEGRPLLQRTAYGYGGHCWHTVSARHVIEVLAARCLLGHAMLLVPEADTG